MPSSQFARCRLASLTLVLAACQSELPVGVPVEAAFAKPGGPAADPTVTSTDPVAAPQDTTLDVRVLGTGYDRGSKVELLLAGQPVTTIRTNSTRYVSANELVANITVEPEALVASYDVAVTASTGRKGIGTEMFAIKPKGSSTDLDSRATWTFQATLSDAVTAARLYDDGQGTYVGGSCGVAAKIFNTATASNSGDAVLDPDMDPAMGCGPRSLRAEFVAGSPVTFPARTNAHQVWQMAPGAVRHGVTMAMTQAGGPCAKGVILRYDPAQPGTDGVRITRLPDQGLARAWEVETEGAHMVGCYKWSKGSYVYVSAHYLPFRVVIVEVPAPPTGW
jgi:hypothetical protein